jgi:glycosyltransferase involved in cell wall biosynthesis
MLPRFTVIIPTFNRANFITEALDTVFSQELQDYEVIVVDDGSTDDTIERLQPYTNRLTLMRQKNRGPGAARNLGARGAKGEYLAFLDSDDFWFPWALATYAQIIDDNGQPTLIAGSMIYFHERSEVASIGRDALCVERFADYFAASRRGLYCGSCKMVVRRDVFLAAEGFLEENINAEDHDFVMRVGVAPAFVNVISPITIGYRQHPLALTRNLQKTLAGNCRLISMECEGRYPGGAARRRDRQRILTQHTRPLSLDLLREGNRPQAWSLYRQTFSWNLSLGRFQYLVGFLLRAMTGRGAPK